MTAPVSIFTRNDLDIPLGKWLAQVSHAYGMALINVNGPSRPWPELSLPNIEIHPKPYTEVKAMASNGGVMIIDNGLTCFQGKTPTCASFWNGTKISLPPRPDENANTRYRQGIFCFRKTTMTEIELMKQVAIASTAVWLKPQHQHCPTLAAWLNTDFGKLCLGTKKASAFGRLRQELSNSGVAFLEFGTDIIVTYPMEDQHLQTFTRLPNFRLLDTL